MNKVTLSLGVFIAVAAMFAIPTTPAHYLKASSCSSSASNHFASTIGRSSSTSGSCSDVSGASHVTTGGDTAGKSSSSSM
jgi:hypothetical protein